MDRYLQITFIPHMENDWNFFIWLTDENGDALALSDAKNVPWLAKSSSYRTSLSSALFAGETKDYPVSGAIVTMESGYRMIKDGLFAAAGEGIFPGRTIQWFSHIAKTIECLLAGGHFYPYLYHIETAPGKLGFYSHWMPDAHLLTRSGLFAEWLTTLPRLSFDIADIQDENTWQWLHLLIIYWTDALVRGTNGIPSSAGQENVNGWPFHHSQTPWAMTARADEKKKAMQIERETAEWTAPVAHRQKNWCDALRTFRQEQAGRRFLPSRLQIRLAPGDESQPFSPDTAWTYRTTVAGTRNGIQLVWPVEKLTDHSPLGHNGWLDNLLARLKGGVPQRLLEMVGTRFNGLLGPEALDELFHYRRLLEENHVRLLLPDDLAVGESDEDVTVDLDIASAPGQTASPFSLDSLIRYNWQIAIGDLRLGADEFARLVRRNQTFIRQKGRWYHLPIERMKQTYAQMNRMIEQLGRHPDVAGALRLNALQHDKIRTPVRIHTDQALSDYLRRLLHKPVQVIPVPQQFKGILRPYQQKGLTWLVNLRNRRVGGCLADDMGLGKTVQAIAYLDYCRSLPAEDPPAGLLPGPALIICPTSLVANWKNECRAFSPALDLYIHHGAQRSIGRVLEERLAHTDVMITSYAIFTKEIASLSHFYWQSVILDEAQAIKNPHAQKTRALHRIRCGHRLALTGTPIENRLEELWSIMDFLNPGYLGNLERFRKQFIRPVEKKSNTLRTQQLTRIIQPFILRREKTDKRIIRDLPEKYEEKQLCHLSKEQASLYQSVVDRLAGEVAGKAGIHRRGLILAALTRLKQVCDHPALITGGSKAATESGKLESFFQLLDPLFRRDEKVLVFTQYVEMGKILLAETKQRYPDAEALFLSGSLSTRRREQLILRFQSSVRRKTLFVLSLKTGGVGINLTEAGYVFHYDRWWNPAVEEQATDRAYRIGQNRDVRVYKLICKGTLEERIDWLIDRKKDLQQRVLGGGDTWLTELSNDEIFDLIKLREGVV